MIHTQLKQRCLPDIYPVVALMIKLTRLLPLSLARFACSCGEGLGTKLVGLFCRITSKLNLQCKCWLRFCFCSAFSSLTCHNRITIATYHFFTVCVIYDIYIGRRFISFHLYLWPLWYCINSLVPRSPAFFSAT